MQPYSHARFRAVLDREDLLDIGQKLAPRLGEDHPALRPVDQLQAHGLLQRFQLMADRGLGDAVLLRGAGDVLRPRDGSEQFELQHVHGITADQRIEGQKCPSIIACGKMTRKI